MQMKPRVFGLTIMDRTVRSPPRRIESFSNATRCRPRAPRRNAAHGDSPGWSGAEPRVTHTHDISPQRGER
jgi:hypothetical protein